MAEKFEMQDWEINGILAEYSTMREEMRMYLQFLRRDTHLLIVVCGGLLAATMSAPGSSFHIEAMLFWQTIPSIIFLYFMFQVINIHVASLEAKQCLRIEEQLNSLSTITVMDWEYTVGQVARRRLLNTPSTFAAFSIIGVALTAFLAVVGLGWSSVSGFIRAVHVIECMLLAFVSVKWFLDEKSTLPEERHRKGRESLRKQELLLSEFDCGDHHPG